jgi:hypothetical protein
MSRRTWQKSGLGLAALLLGLSQAQADDTFRLSGKGGIQDGGADVKRLDLRSSDQQQDDTVPVWHRYRYGGGFYGGGFYGGFYRGYPGFGYGGYPRYSLNYSYYPHYYSGFNNFNSFYGGGFYGGGFYGYRSYYPSYYGGGFCHINGSIAIVQQAPTTLQLKPNLQPQVQPMNPTLGEPRPVQPQGPNGDFRYDGGPANPVPLPQGTPEPKEMNPILNVPDRAVSLPITPQATTTKLKYAAYGEKPKIETVPAKENDLIVVKGQKK